MSRDRLAHCQSSKLEIFLCQEIISRRVGEKCIRSATCLFLENRFPQRVNEGFTKLPVSALLYNKKLQLECRHSLLSMPKY